MQTINLKGITKMLSSRNNTKISAIAFIALLTLSALVAVLPAFAYYTPAAHRPTGTYVGVSPTRVGLGQKVLINIITNPAPRTPSFWVGNLVGVYPSSWENITVTFTYPDGTKNTYMPIDMTMAQIGVKVPGAAQIVGSLQFEFEPTQVGNYSVSASFPGKAYTNAGVSNALNQTVYYDPSSSTATTFTVQQDQVLNGILNGYPWSPLPTAYWTNPVMTDNREWSAISGAWAQANYGVTGTKYNPYSTAPKSPHIVWATNYGAGGITGGIWGSWGNMAPLTGAGGIVLNGKIYQASALTANSIDCIDLRTGQLLWTKPGTPTIANQLNLAFQTSAQQNEGGISEMLMQFSSGTWTLYNPFNLNPLSTAGNSAIIQTVSNVPTDITAPAFENGSPVTYVIQRGGFNTTIPMNFAYEYLIKWNMSKLIPFAFNDQEPVTNSNWATGIEWNVSIRQPDGSDVGISAVSSSASISVNQFPNAGVAAVHGALGYMGFDMATGRFLWNMSTVETMNGGGTGGPTGPETYGPQMIFDASDNSWVAYDISKGVEMWRTPVGELPWANMHDAVSVFHDGKFYTGRYDGHVYALDLKDGHIVWTSDYIGAEDESIYGNQPFNGAAVGADGILYFSTATVYVLQPRTRFHVLVAIDEATGHFLWKLPMGIAPSALAYGYLVGRDSENGIQYCIGKGKTATTVTAGPAVGSGATIQGTVMDMSPGKPNTPAVSDADMSEWMDYLYGQNATLINSPPTPHGVSVQLTAVGSDGRAIDLGTVTSDESGHFAKAWAPSSEGLYKIYATFAGSESYWSSYAETALSVGPAPETPSQQPAAEAPDNTMLLYGILVAVVVAILIGLAALLSVFRKH